MHQFARSTDSHFISQLQSLFESHDIGCTVTTDLETFPLHKVCYILWVDREIDENIVYFASSILRQQPAEELPITRVSISEEMIHCVSCRYDLRGQDADGRCPECGHPYRIIHEIRCPACSADLPSDFEICWNCGQQLPPATPPSA